MNKILSDYYSLCFQANVSQAHKLWRRKTHAHHALAKKFTARFGTQANLGTIKTQDSLASSLIRLYREYYRQSLLGNQNDKALTTSLCQLARELGLIKRSCSQTKLEEIFIQQLRARGFHALFGTVKPYRSFLLWQRESKRTYKVDLPERRAYVKVIFLEDFLELGWMHFATFGRYYVGGWAKPDALYCVKQAYKLESAKFKVHYLAHEAQHFADYEDFPGLDSVDLEYRAKLSELILCYRPSQFLTKLQLEQANDPAVPHSFAAYKILSALGKRVSENPARILRQQAQELLSRHTQLLKTKRLA